MPSETYHLLDDDLPSKPEAGMPVTADLVPLLEKTGNWAKILAVTNVANAVLQLTLVISFANYLMSAYYMGYTRDVWIQIIWVLSLFAATGLGFFNGIYLWRYARNLNQALLFDDVQEITQAFSSLFLYFKMLGWMTILFLSISALSILYFFT